MSRRSATFNACDFLVEKIKNHCLAHQGEMPNAMTISPNLYEKVREFCTGEQSRLFMGVELYRSRDLEYTQILYKYKTHT
jgi:hypothetical protein